MAKNDPKIVLIAGAASATEATAISNFNTAVQTLLTNAGGAIWNPDTTVLPAVQQAGVGVLPDAAVANDKIFYWAIFKYFSAS